MQKLSGIIVCCLCVSWLATATLAGGPINKESSFFSGWFSSSSRKVESLSDLDAAKMKEAEEKRQVLSYQESMDLPHRRRFPCGPAPCSSFTPTRTPAR